MQKTPYTVDTNDPVLNAIFDEVNYIIGARTGIGCDTWSEYEVREAQQLLHARGVGSYRWNLTHVKQEFVSRRKANKIMSMEDIQRKKRTEG